MNKVKLDSEKHTDNQQQANKNSLPKLNRPPKIRDDRPHSIHPERYERTANAGINIIACLVIAMLTGLVGFTLGTRMQGVSLTQLDYASLNEVYNTLNAKYDGKLDKKELIEGAAKGLVSATGDPYTEYMTAEEYADLEVDLSGELTGVGVEIGLNSDGLLSIISVLDNGPAKQAGIRAGDLIYAVDGEDATNWTASQAAHVVRGEEGTKVKLTVLRNGEKLDFDMIRKKIDNPSVKWEIRDGIGYMRVSTFGDDTGMLAREAAKEFKARDVKGVILDVRSNTGGYVTAAQDLASLWLDKGEIITSERSGDRVIADIKATGDNLLKNMPTVVLIDESTASASEITAGALKDKANAKLVGKQSYGKGLVQEIVQLHNGDVLKVTVAKWYTPNGVNINKEGLKPDYEVDMTIDQYITNDDVQLDKAFELLN